MADRKTRKRWLITRRHLEEAVAQLPDAAVLECEDGSLSRFEDWLEHNELGLAFDELDALGRVNEVPREFWAALLAAAQTMDLTQGVRNCKQALEAFSA